MKTSDPDVDIPEAPLRRKKGMPTGMKILIAVNAIAALAMLSMFPFYSGGRSLLYLCVGIVHAGLSFGLAREYGWARVTMIAYALFQVAGLGSWSMIGIMTLVAEPMTTDKANFLVFSAIAIPFLVWAAIYLLKVIKQGRASTEA